MLELKWGGGGVKAPGDPHLLRYRNEHPVCRLCLNNGYEVSNVLRYEIEMLRFLGLCNGAMVIEWQEKR